MSEVGNQDWNNEELALDVIRSSDNVIRFQRYLARRSWGVFYAVWALLIFEFLALRPILILLTGNVQYSSYASSAADFVSFALVLSFIHVITGKSRDAVKLISHRTGSVDERRIKVGSSRVLFVVYAVVIIVSSIPSLGIPLYITEIAQFFVFVGFAVMMYRSQSLTFGQLTPEGWTAFIAFIVGSFLTIPISYFGGNILSFYADWGGGHIIMASLLHNLSLLRAR